MNIKQFFIQNKIYLSLSAVVLVLLIVLISTINGSDINGETSSAQTRAPKTVSTIRLSDEQFVGGTVEITGEVESQSQATLSPERSGVVQRINADIGDWVPRGQIIIELDTNEAHANLAQAEAGLSLAQSQAISTNVQTGNTELALIDAIESAKTTLDDVKETKVSPLFSNEDELSGFGVTISQGNTTYQIDGYSTVGSQNISYNAGNTVEAMESLSNILSDDGASIIERADKAESALVAMRGLLDAIAQVLSTYTADDIAEQAVYNPFQNNISTARSSITGALTTLRNAVQSYNSAQVADPQSQVEQAKAQVAAAEAKLAQGFIRAPFTGEITAMNTRVGESVSPSQQVLSIVNKNALRVAIAVSPTTAKRLSVGMPAVVDGEYSGAISAVSSAINTQNGKVEAHVTVTDPSADLIVGEFVEVSINVSGMEGETMLPFSAVEVTGSGSSVYVIDDGKAVKIPIETGEVVGDAVTVISGLSGNEAVIVNADTVTDGEDVISAESVNVSQ